MKYYNLMIPGPVEIDFEVLQEMASPQLPHYNEEVIEIYNRCIEYLRKIFGLYSQGDIFIMNGSGNVALDAVTGSVIHKDDKVLVGINGCWGRAMRDIACSYGARVIEVRAREGQVITAEMIRATVERNKSIRAIMVVHTETSAGIVNPIEEIGGVANEYDIPLIVDAVCSIGVEEFAMEKWNVSFSCTSSQKGLQAPPGLGIAAISKRGWKAIEERKAPDHGWYSNLLNWKKAAETNIVTKGIIYPMFVTMAVNNVRALHSSLSKIIEEGIDNRIKRHSEVASIVREGMKNLGFKIFPEEKYSAHALTVVSNNLNIDIQKLIEFLKYKYNIEISDGLDELRGKVFRIGHIGRSASLNHIIPVLFGVEDFLRKEGIKIPIGASLVGVK